MMDSPACTNQSEEISDRPQDSVESINNDSNVETSKNVGSQSPKANALLPLGPVTPDSNKEIGDVPFILNSSPLTGLNNPRKTICFDTDSSDSTDLLVSTDHCSSPRTPGATVFDPFAPGPEDMMLAPRCKKLISQPKFSVSRRLVFDSDTNTPEDGSNNVVVPLSDEEMIETVYENLLEVIISMQTEGVVELSKAEWGSDEDCRTPPLAPCVNGIAETCPGAPRKPSGKSKNIDLGLCRKLEF